MITEEAIKELREASDSEVRYGDTDNHYDEVMKRVEAFDMAIKALEEVSRLPENLHREREQAYMNGYYDGKRNAMKIKKSAYDDAVERIEKSTFTLHDGLDCVETLVALEAVMIASAQTKPTRSTGYWIKYQEPWGGMQGWKCSNCKNHYDVSSVYTIIPYNYCPNCGSAMTEE